MKKILLFALVLLLLLGGLAFIKERSGFDETNEYVYKPNRVLIEHGVGENKTFSYYPTLGDAIAAADEGDIVILQDDIFLDTTIELDKSITIDGGTAKHKITSTITNELFVAKNEISGLFALHRCNIETQGRAISLSGANMDLEIVDTTIVSNKNHCVIATGNTVTCNMRIESSTLTSGTTFAVVAQHIPAHVALDIANSTIRSGGSDGTLLVRWNNDADVDVNIDNCQISCDEGAAIRMQNGTLAIANSQISSVSSRGILLEYGILRTDNCEIKSVADYAVVATKNPQITFKDTRLISEGTYALHTGKNASICLSGYTYLTGAESDSGDILYSGSKLVFDNDYTGSPFMLYSDNCYYFYDTLDVALADRAKYVSPAYAITEAARRTAAEAGHSLSYDDVTGFYVVVVDAEPVDQTALAGAYVAGTSFTEKYCTWEEMVESYELNIDSETPYYSEAGKELCAPGDDVIVPDDVTYVASFDANSIVFPETTTSIGSVYDRCYAIYIRAKTPPELIGGLQGMAMSEPPTIVVPVGYGEIYKTAERWSVYADYIVEGEMPI